MTAPQRHPLGVTALFTRLGELFIAGRLSEMTAFWTFPCPVAIDGDLVVLPAPEALEAHFARQYRRARALGLSDLAPRVIAIEMPRRGRFRTWMRWTYRLRGHPAEDEHATVYYLAQRPWSALTIEMMDVVANRPTSP